MSRNIEAMCETKKQVLDQCGPTFENHVSVIRADFSQIECLKTALTEVFELEKQTPYEQTILINNAGSLGELKFAHELADSTNLVNDHMTENVTACYVLNSIFLATFLVRQTTFTNHCRIFKKQSLMFRHY
jgi:short-subunit dehydrogenase